MFTVDFKKQFNYLLFYVHTKKRMIISPLLESIILFSQISVSGTEARSQCVACGPLIAIAYLLKPRQPAWDSPHAHVQLLQSWYFCHPMDYRLPGSSVHGILQARILEWVAAPFSRGVFLTQGWNLRLLCLLHCRQILYPLRHLGSPWDGPREDKTHNTS